MTTASVYAEDGSGYLNSWDAGTTQADYDAAREGSNYQHSEGAIDEVMQWERATYYELDRTYWSFDVTAYSNVTGASIRAMSNDYSTSHCGGDQHDVLVYSAEWEGDDIGAAACRAVNWDHSYPEFDANAVLEGTFVDSTTATSFGDHWWQMEVATSNICSGCDTRYCLVCSCDVAGTKPVDDGSETWFMSASNTTACKPRLIIEYTAVGNYGWIF